MARVRSTARVTRDGEEARVRSTARVTRDGEGTLNISSVVYSILVSR
jgi:hypothetical protein